MRSHSLLTMHSRSSSTQFILAPTASATVTSSARSLKSELKHTSSFSDASQLNLKEVIATGLELNLHFELCLSLQVCLAMQLICLVISQF